MSSATLIVSDGGTMELGYGRTAGGLLLGSVMSLLFFNRRAWPLLVGSGFGIGVAYRTCEKDLNS